MKEKTACSIYFANKECTEGKFSCRGVSESSIERHLAVCHCKELESLESKLLESKPASVIKDHLAKKSKEPRLDVEGINM